MTLFSQEALEPDIWIAGTKKPMVRHPDHSNPQMHRPFIFWDGEGYTDEWNQHHYWLLANSLGDKIIAPPGRSLERYSIARLFMETADAYPAAIHTGFALGYDFTCAIRGNGFTKEQANTLKDKQYLNGDGYIWKVRTGKQLTLYYAGLERGTQFKLYDTWGFFQRSFINALNEYFPDGWEHREVITEMKAQRGSFDREHDTDVMLYNDYELELGVNLMEELRDRLFTASMPISQWYGPGAIASGLLTKWKIKDKQVDLYVENPAVADAAQHAYAGGRFELFKCGRVNGPVYQYDINSAYPWAIAQLPNWKLGEWVHHRGGTVDELTEYSMALVRWDNTHLLSNAQLADKTELSLYPESIPFPFWHRSKQGNISYPSGGIKGWYWSPEIHSAASYLSNLPSYYDKNIQIEEWWEFKEYTNERPFKEVSTLYVTRQKLKAKGNGAHIGIKLGLNSLYGKLAQQIGWTDDKQRKPPFHNLAAAGYVTAKCRALLMGGIALDPAAIIATETDGIFSTRELPLECSSALGSWEQTVYDDMWYFQSGFRFGIKDGEVVKPATRGIPVADISLEAVRARIVDSASEMKVDTNQFVTLGLALHRNKPEIAGQWIKKTGEDGKKLILMCEEPQGKRIHEPNCPECTVPEGSTVRIYHWEGLHLTFPSTGHEFQMSNPHKVMWSEIAAENRDVWVHEDDGLEY